MDDSPVDWLGSNPACAVQEGFNEPFLTALPHPGAASRFLGNTAIRRTLAVCIETPTAGRGGRGGQRNDRALAEVS